MIITALEEYEYLVTPDLCDSYISNISWPVSSSYKDLADQPENLSIEDPIPIVQLRCIIS